ncbi:MAG: GatB/YqeY domain-containing protein [Acidobacteriaceae bacterium]
MELVKKIDQDMVAAMKAHDVERTQTLRMAKSALKNKAIDKRGDLTDAEAQQVFNTMINQRKDSIEQFTKGNRPELAAKEAREIVLLESYLPKMASEEDLKKTVEETLAGSSFGPKDMGAAMKAVQARIQQQGWRADGRQLSEIVKGRLGQ